MPFSTSAPRPESSAIDGSPVNAAMARAFSSAFSPNVSPVSATSGAPGNSSSPLRVTVRPAVCRIRRSSATLCGFHVARTSRLDGAEPASVPLNGLGEGIMLQSGQLTAAGYGEVEQPAKHFPSERLPLGGPLHLDEVPVAGAYDVHVGLGGRILLVAQVDARLPLDDA